MKKVALNLTVLLFFTIAGCAPLEVIRFDRINVGMSRPEVSEALGLHIGKPIGTMVLSDNMFVEVWEYKQNSFTPQDEAYWLYFFNGKLEKWDRSNHNNWQAEAVSIYETRFK